MHLNYLVKLREQNNLDRFRKKKTKKNMALVNISVALFM